MGMMGLCRRGSQGDGLWWWHENGDSRGASWELLMNFVTTIQSEYRREPGRNRSRWVVWMSGMAWWRGLPRWRRRERRRLFLDDDPTRAEVFLKENGGAIWVTTAADCVRRLEERWDEVHLDHDLGGETDVDFRTLNCGMEVIRWLCAEPRVHLRRTYFVVHTHNVAAGLMMILLMRATGYRAEFRPFGQDLSQVLAHNEVMERRGWSVVCGEAAVNWWRAVRWRTIRKPQKKGLGRGVWFRWW